MCWTSSALEGDWSRGWESCPEGSCLPRPLGQDSRVWGAGLAWRGHRALESGHTARAGHPGLRGDPWAEHRAQQASGPFGWVGRVSLHGAVHTTPSSGCMAGRHGRLRCALSPPAGPRVTWGGPGQRTAAPGRRRWALGLFLGCVRGRSGVHSKQSVTVKVQQRKQIQTWAAEQ